MRKRIPKNNYNVSYINDPSSTSNTYYNSCCNVNDSKNNVICSDNTGCVLNIDSICVNYNGNNYISNNIQKGDDLNKVIDSLVKNNKISKTRVITSNGTQNIQADDETILFTGFPTGSGTNLNLPNPSLLEGKQLTIIENTASNWTLNHSIYRTSGPPLTILGQSNYSTSTIRVINGSWWLISHT